MYDLLAEQPQAAQLDRLMRIVVRALALLLPASGRHRPRTIPPQPRPADAETLRLALRQEWLNGRDVDLVRPYVHLNPRESP